MGLPRADLWSEAVLEHLVALQIKAMAERKAIRSERDLIDRVRDRSKNHKDKGTINNPCPGGDIRFKRKYRDQQSTQNTQSLPRVSQDDQNDLIRFVRQRLDLAPAKQCTKIAGHTGLPEPTTAG